jgi:peroxiredoxin Q/BCP
MVKIGDKAPDFKSTIQTGESISLKDFKGKKVVLYFYPKDDTPGCTAQACNLRDNYKALLKAGYVVLGVSSDSVKKHIKFIEKYDLPFPLIADEDQTVQNLYGVWGEKQMMGKKYMGTIRTTFVIDEKGIVIDKIEKVNTKEHYQQILP